MIRLGPAGICVTARKKTTIGSLKRISELQLSAQEVEYVRGVNMSITTAKEVGKVAKELGIELSVHCPYYINLCSKEEKKIEDSKKRILDSAERADAMGARVIVFHPAYYGKLPENQALDLVKNSCLEIREEIEGNGWNVSLGLETTGKISAFGTLDEITKISKEVKGVVPYVDWCHLFVRNNGKIDYSEIFDKLEVLKLDHVYSHFSNSKYNVNTKKFVDVHVPIDSHPPFESLAREILKRKIDISIVSESPVLEMDSIRMKKTFEKLGYKFS